MRIRCVAAVLRDEQPLLVGEADTVFGDALEVITNGLLDWLPIVEDLAVLEDENPESKTLRTILFDEGEPHFG